MLVNFFSADSITPTAAKDTQLPADPCDLTGVSKPRSSKLYFDGMDVELTIAFVNVGVIVSFCMYSFDWIVRYE
jgi:hypothetical protein